MSSNPRKTRQSFFNAQFTATISISLVLFLLGLLTFFGLMAKEISVTLKENISFSVILEDKIPQAELAKLNQEFKKAAYVKSFNYISKEDALKVLTEELGENPAEFLGFNPLQASFEVNLNAEYANNDSIAHIEKSLVKISKSEFMSFNYSKDMIEMVNDNMRKIGIILGVFAIGMLLISISLILNTVRLSVHSKRFMISTMRLVGATNSFIRGPFIRTYIGSGIIASFLAMGMLCGAIYYITQEFIGIQTLITPELIALVFGIILCLGIIISGLASYMAINRYLKMDTDKMYLV